MMDAIQPKSRDEILPASAPDTFMITTIASRENG